MPATITKKQTPRRIPPQQPAPVTQRLYSVNETAQMLGKSVACIREWVWHRRISFHRVGRHIRIPQSTIDSLLDRGYVPADPRASKVIQ